MQLYLCACLLTQAIGAQDVDFSPRGFRGVQLKEACLLDMPECTFALQGYIDDFISKENKDACRAKGLSCKKVTYA